MPDAIAKLLELGLCCPRCRGDLVPDVSDGEGTLRCKACAHDWPVLLGIPDLRTFADPYIDMEADRAKGRRLKAEGGKTWQEMVRFYYEITESVTAAQAVQFAAGLRSAEPRAQAVVAAWDVLDPIEGRADALLEIGCGTAPLLVASGARAGTCVGVDVAFRWLVVGQQRLADAGITAHLVCACAEALPFRAGRFDLVESQGTIENVRDAQQAVAEAGRVLAPGGRLRVSTANRSSIGPDPHLGIPAGGMLPDRVAASIARSRGALPPQRQMVTIAGLAELIESNGFTERRYGAPGIADAQRRDSGALTQAAIGLYESSRRLPLLRDLLMVVGPTLLATARKP